MTEGLRKLIAAGLGLASYTVIAVVISIDAAQTAMPFILSIVGTFVGANLLEHKMANKTNGTS